MIHSHIININIYPIQGQNTDISTIYLLICRIFRFTIICLENKKRGRLSGIFFITHDCDLMKFVVAINQMTYVIQVKLILISLPWLTAMDKKQI